MSTGPDSDALREVKLAQQDLEGEYPNGRMNREDDGAMAMSIGIVTGDNGQQLLQVAFATPLQWFGLTPDQGIEFAEVLMRRAREAGATRPFTLQIGGG